MGVTKSSKMALNSVRFMLARSLSTKVQTTGLSLSQCRLFCAAADIQKHIDEIVKKSDVVVFMKGVPDAPRCGFSNVVCQIMRMHDVPFDSHNVLENEDVRQGIKDYSNWPTIPQVFFKGEFIGGCDILLQMHQSGELVEELQKIGIKSALLTAEESDDKKPWDFG